MPRAATRIAANGLTAITMPVTLEVSGVRISSRVISVEELLTFERNPKQRDEKIRKATHLKTLVPSQGVVAIVIDGATTFIVDGHTRIEWIRKGKLSGLTHVFAIVYELIDASLNLDTTARALYDTYDSRKAAKSNPEEIQGAMNEYGIKLSTPWLTSGNYSSMLNLAAEYVPGAPKDKIERVKFFKDELELFDTLEPIKSRFVIGIGAAALLFLKKNGAAALPFLENHSKGHGLIVNANGRNPLAFLDEHLKVSRARNKLQGKRPNQKTLHYALTCMVLALSKPQPSVEPTLLDIDAFKDSFR